MYQQNQGAIDNVLASQRDFGKQRQRLWPLPLQMLTRRLDWTSKQITYGLYLSDHSILNDVETEITVLSGIMIQNLPRETGWHLRGTRRIGVSMEDTEMIQQCVSTVQIRTTLSR